MFYTKLVIQNSDPVVVAESYISSINKRWDFVAVSTTGGTKAHRETATGEWILNPEFNSYNSKESKDYCDQLTIDPATILNGSTYYEGIKVWDSATVAQDFVTAVQALNIAGVTITYEGDTDPTAV
jgi:hypothetical protein